MRNALSYVAKAQRSVAAIVLRHAFIQTTVFLLSYQRAPHRKRGCSARAIIPGRRKP